MKNIKKILTSLASGAIIASAATAVASCSCAQSTFIEAAETDISIVGNNVYNYLVFTLNNGLKDGQTITTNLQNTDYFTYGDPVIENKLLSIPVVWNQLNVVKSKTETKDITFTCKNSDGTVAWEQTISNCKTTYSPLIVLKDESKVVTENVDDKTLTYELTFELGEKLDSILSLKPWFTDVEDVNTGSKTTYSIDQKDCTVTVDGTTVKVKVVATKSSKVVEGDGVKFNLQIECLASNTWTYWQSNIFSGITINYVQEEIALDERCFETDSSADGTLTITGIDTDSPYYNPKANTFLIPAKTTSTWYRYVGKEEQSAEDHFKLPSNITKIKIGGIGVQEIRPYTFYGNTNIKYIDFEAIDDTVKSLDSVLVFDDNSFSGWNNEGHIVWNKDISQYKRHIVKEKLYRAGLTSSKWFGYVDVNNVSALKEAAYIGGNIRLTDDIKITPDEEYNGQINFYTSSILDLNGHTISVQTRPIFNSLTKEFAVIGVWDCELLVTDSSSTHSGSIKAFDNSKIHEKTRPTQEGKEYENEQWEWQTNWDGKGNNRWRTRENRVFYVRSDIPTRSKGTLEIVAGNFVGNCTTIMNWNTTVYVEDTYSARPETAAEYKGEYAPTFELYSKNCSLTKPDTYDNPTAEIINCEDTTSITGEAKFELWGGKFKAYQKKLSDTSYGDYVYYLPESSKADKTPTPEGETQRYGHWNHIYDDDGYETSVLASIEIKDEKNKWTVMVPNEWLE